MEHRHTPGPWKTIPSPHGRKYLCVQLGADEMYTTLEMLPANARLIAAAPDFLDASEIAIVELEAVEREIGIPSKALPLLRAAIARCQPAHTSDAPVKHDSLCYF